MVAQTAINPKLEFKIRRDFIKPLPRQLEALKAMYRHEYLLYGGAAGPGKSRFLRNALVELHFYWASQGIINVTTGLFCESYPALKDRQITKIASEFPLWLGELKDSQAHGWGFHFRARWGGGMIALRNLDDPAKYASAEFAAIAVDELTKNDRQTFDDLRFRKRWPGIEHSPFIAASNPGSIGHGWVKQLWVDRDFSSDDNARFDPNSFVFIKALPRDNPYLPQSYWDTLNSLPEAMRRAMLEGDWDVFSGQVFTEWRRDIHVARPFAIPADWQRWVAIDYGFVNPFCALWFARSPNQERVVIYRELYASGYSAQSQAAWIRSTSADERIRLALGDPSMWARREGHTDIQPSGRRQTVGGSYADEYGPEWSGWGVPLLKANNNRVGGKNWVHQALAYEISQGGALVIPPLLQVFPNCVNLIRTLPQLVYDKRDPEDVDTQGEDHAYDALRYGLGYHYDRRQREAVPVQMRWQR